MSQFRDLIARMAVDAEFARHARANPETVARQYGLTADETEQLRGLADASASAGPTALGARLSKSGIGTGGLAGLLQPGLPLELPEPMSLPDAWEMPGVLEHSAAPTPPMSLFTIPDIDLSHGPVGLPHVHIELDDLGPVAPPDLNPHLGHSWDPSSIGPLLPVDPDLFPDDDQSFTAGDDPAGDLGGPQTGEALPLTPDAGQAAALPGGGGIGAHEVLVGGIGLVAGAAAGAVAGAVAGRAGAWGDDEQTIRGVGGPA